MNLYPDDHFTGSALVGKLRRRGHQVVLPVDASLGGATDPVHLEFAIRSRLTVLTKDHDDFFELHQLVVTSGGSHPGILVVSEERDSTKNMTLGHIVAAIGKIERSGVPVANEITVLNQWR